MWSQAKGASLMTTLRQRMLEDLQIRNYKMTRCPQRSHCSTRPPRAEVRQSRMVEKDNSNPIVRLAQFNEFYRKCSRRPLAGIISPSHASTHYKRAHYKRAPHFV